LGCREALKKNILATSTELFYTLIPIVQFIAIGSILIYCYRSLGMIRKYHSWVKANYSNDDKYNLRWLYRLTFIFGLLWFMLVPYTLIDFLFFDFDLGIKDYYPIYILLSLITLWISIEAFLKPELVFLEKVKIKETKTDNPKSNELLKKADWLRLEMERNLFYLDSELSLTSLAKALEIHPNNLSKIINDGVGSSFSDFVNEYRVKAVTEKLKDPKYDHITLLGISFDCGFNSKTTFNRVFKNITGQTPFNYKKGLQKLS